MASEKTQSRFGEVYQRPELVVGKTYRIELYPNRDIVEGRYLGEGRLEDVEEHVFKGVGEKGAHILVDDCWIAEREGVLTHVPISSFAVARIDSKSILNLDGESRAGLVNLIKSVGSEI